MTVSYAYEYRCDGRSGNVDGLETAAVYRVTEDATDLVRVVADVRNVWEA